MIVEKTERENEKLIRYFYITFVSQINKNSIHVDNVDLILSYLD